MTPEDFKRGIYGALQSLGFKKRGKSVYRDQENVMVLVSIEKASRWYIDVGFWLKSLGGEITTDRHEKTHIYMRLDRIFPVHRDIIRAACDLGASDQLIGYTRLLELLPTVMDGKLRSMGSDDVDRGPN